MSPVVTIEGISKRFGAVWALTDISLSLYPGQVLGILGDNGAGKSTLVGILSGSIQPTRGSLSFDGRHLSIHSPHDAHMLGIETVYQDLALAKDLTVWQNIFLGNEQTRGGFLKRVGWLDRKSMTEASAKAVVETGIKLASVESFCGRLSGGQRQTTAITAAISWATRILLLDEPTSALGPRERQRVNGLIRSVAERGLAVLLVSQDLSQVEEVCERTIVLRHGRIVAEVARGAESTVDLISYITGARAQRQTNEIARPEVSLETPPASSSFATDGPTEDESSQSSPALDIGLAPVAEATAVTDSRPGPPALVKADLHEVLAVEGVSKQYGVVSALSDVTLRLHAGEIVGLVGHNGAGKSTLVGVLSGTVRPTRGRVALEGKELVLRSPLDAHTAGIETVYQDLALANELNGWQNVFLGQELTRQGLLGRLGWLDRQAMAGATIEGIATTGIGVKSVVSRCAELSAGQCQTLAVVRAMMWGQRVLLFDEPTSALGVEEQERVNTLMRSLAERGIAILVISHNLPKVHEVCDRIVVLRMGSVVAETRPSECSLDELVEHITGKDGDA